MLGIGTQMCRTNKKYVYVLNYYKKKWNKGHGLSDKCFDTKSIIVTPITSDGYTGVFLEDPY